MTTAITAPVPFDPTGSTNPLQPGNLYCIGRPGTGKSKFFERIERTFIKRQVPHLLLDNKGELYDNVLNFMTAWNVKPADVCLIDPRSPNPPGFNPLQCPDGVHPITQAGIVSDSIAKMFHEDQEAKMWIQEYGPFCFSSLSAAGMTLREAPRFLNPADANFRKFVLSTIPSADFDYYREKQAAFDASFKTAEKAKILQGISTRLDYLLRHPWLRAMLSQKKTTINLERIFSKGRGVLMANLGNNGSIEPKAAEFIGAMLLNSVNTLARRRKPDAVPVYVVMDEFHKILSRDISDSLESLRYYQTFFCMAHQTTQQLEKNHPDILASVMACCQYKAVFSISRQDAEYLRGELFSGEMYADTQKVKHSSKTLSFVSFPLIIPLTSTSTTEGESTSETDTWSENSSYTDSSGDSYDKDGDIIGTTAGGGSSFGDSRGESKTKTKTKSTTTSTTPSVIGIPIPYWNEGSRTFFSLPEVQEKYAGMLATQKPRHFILKLPNCPPVQRVTDTVLPVPISDRKLARYLEKVRSVALPSSGVYDGLISTNDTPPTITNDDEPPTSEPKRRNKRSD